MSTLHEEYNKFMKSYEFDKIESSNEWASVSLGTPIKISFPNLNARKKAVLFHDINHIITGFRAQTFVGEIQAAYFEIFSGCGPYWFAWFINSLALPFGLFVPHKVIAALKMAKAARKNAYCVNIDELWNKDVDDIRKDWNIEN